MWQCVFAYRQFKGMEVAYAEAGLAVAETKAGLVSVEMTDYYTGDGGYQIYVGNDRSGDEVVVWVQKKKAWKEKLSDGVKAEDVLAKLKDVTVKRITLGMVTTKGKKQPVWEVFYETPTGAYRYEQFDFYTGKSIGNINL